VEILLEGHRRCFSVTMDVLGFDPETHRRRGDRDYRERIGIVLQEAGFEDDVTVREFAGYPNQRE
jgi:ABC-2 type transport system ATP-binding protein